MDRRQGLRFVAGAVSMAMGPSNASLARTYSPADTPKRGYATGPFGLVHYQDTGGNGLPLVLCHQSPQSSRQFDPVLPELSKRGIRAIAIDAPGFGMSDATPFEPRVEDYAQVIPPVLDHLHIGRSNLLGHHTGASVVTEASLQFPNRVLRLVINGPNPREDEERRGLIDKYTAEQHYIYEPDGSHLMKSFQIRWDLYGPGGDPKLTTRVVAEKFIGYGPFWYGHIAGSAYNTKAALPRIKHKTLILTNTGDVLYNLALVARKMRPDFAYVELQGGTIDIVDQQPAAWADAVVTFLRS